MLIFFYKVCTITFFFLNPFLFIPCIIHLITSLITFTKNKMYPIFSPRGSYFDSSDPPKNNIYRDPIITQPKIGIMMCTKP
jgi:hypothetical protein